MTATGRPRAAPLHSARTLRRRPRAALHGGAAAARAALGVPLLPRQAPCVFCMERADCMGGGGGVRVSKLALIPGALWCRARAWCSRVCIYTFSLTYTLIP
jgi:hypothetical protein